MERGLRLRPGSLQPGVDLLVCRNTLMYFNAEAQARILPRFDFALNGGGFLFLGKAEVLLTDVTPLQTAAG